MPAVSWLLNTVYIGLLLALSPVLLYRRVVLGKYRDGWAQKFLGRLPERTGERPCVWFHAVSVGEVLQLKHVLSKLRTSRPDTEFVISTTTSTGLEVARDSFPNDRVCYFPLDFSWSVRRAIDRVRPTAIVLVELEIWPNFIFAAHAAGVPLALINGRISERSYRGYRRIGWLMRRLLGCFQKLAVQNDTYANRLRGLGASVDQIETTGSIKFDGLETSRSNCRTAELRTAFDLADDELVFIAGSTQSPEEELALETYEQLRRTHPKLRLVLVPRHKERFDDVARLIRNWGHPLLRRSRIASRDLNESNNPVRSIILLDTLGELAACWGLADIAYVGGSLTKRGGQNMLEPAAYGAALLFGPNTWNFRDAVELLLEADAATVVHNADELTQAVRQFVEIPQRAGELGGRARQIVLAQQGATSQTVALVETLLPKPVEPPKLLPQERAA